MADINQIITLGIGVPASIEHYILFGLSPSDAVVHAIAPAFRRALVPFDNRVAKVGSEGRGIKVGSETRTTKVED